jgi:hypothetical protein
LTEGTRFQRGAIQGFEPADAGYCAALEALRGTRWRRQSLRAERQPERSQSDFDSITGKGVAA